MSSDPLSVSSPAPKTSQVTIQLSTDGVNWNDHTAGTEDDWNLTDALPYKGDTYYFVRGYSDTNGDIHYLASGQQYYFRLQGTSQVSNAAQTRAPEQKMSDSEVVFTGLKQTVSSSLTGLILNTAGGAAPLSWAAVPGDPLTTQQQEESIGSIWENFVNQGYNAFLSPTPNDAGSAAGQQVVKADGSGWLVGEIMDQSGTAPNIALLGLSAGAGLANAFSHWLFGLGAPPISPHPLTVVFSATIDGIDITDDLSLEAYPGALWDAPGWNGYEQLHDPRFKINVRRQRHFVSEGVSMDFPGVTNRQYFNLLPAPGVRIPHVLIGMDPGVLGDAEAAMTGGLP